MKKKKYEVTFYFTSSASYVVDAEDADDALDMARDKIAELTRDKVKDNQIMRNLDEDESVTTVEEL